MIPAFNKRIEPKRVAGLPEQVFFMGPAVIVLIVMAIIVPVIPVKIAFLVAALGVIYLVIDTFRWFDFWLIRKSMQRGEQRRRWPSFGAANRKTYVDAFPWDTFIGDHGLIHDGPSVSVAIEWSGIQDRHWDDSQRQQEHQRRVAMFRSLSDTPGLTVENHLIREHDASLADAYLVEGQRMHRDHPQPAIVADLREKLVETYRPLARSNRVLTVLTLGRPKRQGLFALLSPQAQWRARTAKDLYATLMEVVSTIETELPGARLLSSDEYQRQIQAVRDLGAVPHAVDWRHRLADQLITEKPSIKDGNLMLNCRYYRCCLVQNYPNLPLDWPLVYCELPVDVHACQIVQPKRVDDAMDKSRKQADYEAQTMSNNRGADQTISKVQDSQAFRDYVMARNLPVADNAYIVTFVADNPEHVAHFATRFKQSVHKNEGFVRDNEDLQQDLFEVRLPGAGSTTFFAREDHGDVLAATMPATTFSQGNTEHPESLRITASGQLVGFAPSRLEVPHELVVAQTGGGKDTQFGMKFLETYAAVRYDIVEMGNSYQAAVEAVGGSYCRAREQVINPLAGYEEYNSALHLRERGHGHIDSDFIRSQSDMLNPIFKGLKGDQYTRPEQAVVDATLRQLYNNPEDVSAPTLPMVLDTLKAVEVTSEAQEQARQRLTSELYEFLETETGQVFKAEDQFTISPIANALDVGGFSGELFQYYLTFMVVRLATNAMARGARSQIVLNEYGTLLQNAAEPIRWITFTIDRMGRKEWVGLTRITQGVEEIRSVDSEALSSIQNRTLLSREDNHAEIGSLLKMPQSIIRGWSQFKPPEQMDRLGYREAMVQELGDWHKLFLKFPPLLLDLMNTKGKDKQLRERAFELADDPYERIRILRELIQERDNADKEIKDGNETTTSPEDQNAYI